MMRSRWAGAALAVALGMMTAGSAGAQQTDVALVYRLLDQAQMVVTRGNTPQPPAKIGDRLRNGDQVFTSGNTRAALRFTDDGSILRLNPNSQVALTSRNENGVVVRTLSLEFGELWARVNRRDGTHLRVSTPAGVAAVKGTEFLVRYRDGVATVITLEGVVEFFNGAGRVDVTAGQKVTADSATAPRSQPATRDELRETAGAGGEDRGAVQGTWVEVQLRDASGQTRSLMLQLPADAVRQRLEGRP
ncbi:MAG TPA: FecR family protein [Longimicrobium sp.]|nr:FecR family protein [Longimicrobium sp.]